MSESIDNAKAVIDLSAPRVIVLSGVHGTYRLTCRPVTSEDWIAYYEALEMTSQRDGKNMLDALDLDTPRRVLAERVLIQAEGYQVEGGGDLMAMPNWQTRIPLGHRQRVGETLANVRYDRSEDGVICVDGERVTMSALWTADDKGGMKLFSGLKHVLRTPSEEQYRRFSRASNRTIILGGTRAGTTVYPGSQPLLADLYDELVVSVDGYIADEEPLAGADAIARSMDMHHKVCVAQRIFDPPMQQIATGEATT